MTDPAPRPPQKPIALVTGGNRGVGLAICRGLARAGMTVLLGSRDARKGEEAVAGLREEGLKARAVGVDVADVGSVARCAEAVLGEFRRLDVLVNNAGVYLDGDARGPLGLEDEVVRRTFEVNLYGPLRTCRAFVPGMVERGRGRVVNVSSDCGSMAWMHPGGCTAAYRVSKAALNALTRLLAGEVSGAPDVKVNAMCPGWVDTDMGRLEGSPSRTPERGADTAVWLATLPEDGPTGGFFQDRGPIPW